MPLSVKIILDTISQSFNLILFTMKKGILIFFIGLFASIKICAQDNLWIAEIGTWGDSLSATATYDHYCFNGFYVGAGLGVTWNFAYPVSYPVNGTIGKTYNSRILVPVYTNIRYYIAQKKISPFIDFKGGFLSDYTHKEVGFFLRPSFGCEIKKFGINIGFEYNNLQGSPLSKGDNFMRGYLGLSYTF